MLFPGGKLLLDIFLLGQTSVELEHRGLQLDGHLLVPLQSDLQFVDLELISRALLLHCARQLSNLCIFSHAELLLLYGHLVQVLLEEGVDAGDLGLPSTILPFLLLLLETHFVEVILFFSSKSIVKVFKLTQESGLLLVELLISTSHLTIVLVSLFNTFLTIALFFGCELIMVPLVQASVLSSAHTKLLVSFLLVRAELLRPLLFTLTGAFTKIRALRVFASDLTIVTLVLIGFALEIGLLDSGSFLLLLLNLVHELLDLGLKLVLELLLHLGVLFHLLGSHSQGRLELLASIFAIADKLLVLGDVLLEVVKHLKFLVKGDQRVKLVLKLNVLLFERELELVALSLVEHSIGEALSRRGRRLGRRPDEGGLGIG